MPIKVSYGSFTSPSNKFTALSNLSRQPVLQKPTTWPLYMVREFSAIVMHQGEIGEAQQTAKLFENPTTTYTRELIDAIPLPNLDQHWM